MFLKKKPLNRGSRAKDFKVTVMFRRDVTMLGEVTHLSSQKSQSFRSLLELIILIHDRLEELGMPVPGVKPRTWLRPHLNLEQKGDSKMDDKTDETTELKVGSTVFLIRILFRQNSTWMGEIHWLEGEKKIHFRSLLEMIMLMQEALDITNAPPAEYSFRTWEDEEQVTG